jgi:hypothetical protein
VLPSQTERAPRVRFKHPIRVVTLDGPPRVIRTLTANVSTKGLFVRMPQPLPAGARVALSLEAGGRALAFAQAQVAWTRSQESALPGRFPGCGVRFTEFLHPRAQALVDYLVDNLDRGKPLTLPRRVRAPGWSLWGGGAAGLVAVVGGLVLLWPPSSALDPAEAGDEELAPLVALAPAPMQVAVPALMPELDLTADAPGSAASPKGDTLARVSASTTLDVRDAAPSVAAPSEASLDARAEHTLASPSAAPSGEAPVGTEAALEALPTGVRAEPSNLSAGEPEPGALFRQGSLVLPAGAVRRLRWAAAGERVTLTPMLAPGASLTRAFVLRAPPRAVFDVAGDVPAKAERFDFDAPHTAAVRLGKQPRATRVVVDLDAEPKTVSADDGALTLGF